MGCKYNMLLASRMHYSELHSLCNFMLLLNQQFPLPASNHLLWLIKYPDITQLRTSNQVIKPIITSKNHIATD